MNENSLANYGTRTDIEELGQRVKRFLPNGSKMTAEEAVGFAQIAIAQDLNPFAHEIWFIPGIGPVTGIEGYRKLARRQGSFSTNLRMMTGPEREAHKLSLDDFGAVCELYRPDVIMAAVQVNEAAKKIVIPIQPIIGIGIKRPGEKNAFIPTGRSFLWVAQKRAEADALRKGFNISVSYAEDVETGAVAMPAGLVERPAWVVVEEPIVERPTDPDAVLARCNEILQGADDDPLAPKQPETQPAQSMPEASAPQFPTAWPEFAALAVKQLGYKSPGAVVTALRDGGIYPVSDVDGKIAFLAADGWSVLSGQKE